jgi:hypothetical protein
MSGKQQFRPLWSCRVLSTWGIDHSQEHHHHHAIEHDDSTWAHKPGTIAPHDTGVRYDTVHMGVQPATVNPLPNEPWVSSTATNSHNDKEHEHSKRQYRP